MAVGYAHPRQCEGSVSHPGFLGEYSYAVGAPDVVPKEVHEAPAQEQQFPQSITHSTRALPSSSSSTVCFPPAPRRPQHPRLPPPARLLPPPAPRPQQPKLPPPRRLLPKANPPNPAGEEEEEEEEAEEEEEDEKKGEEEADIPPIPAIDDNDDDMPELPHIHNK